jgi:transposase InsO family protein
MRECLALLAATSLSRARVVRELTSLMGRRGKPYTVVRDNGTGLTLSAILRRLQELRVQWHYIAPGKPMQNGFVERLASPPSGSIVACGTSASTRHRSHRWPLPGSCWTPGGTIAI